MPSHRQSTGNRFRGKPRGSSTHRVQRRTPITSPDGGTQIETTTTTRTKRGKQRQNRRTERRTPIATGGTQTETTTSDTGPGPGSRNLRQFNPVKTGEKVSGVGLLEVEFIACELFIFAELFTGPGSYGDKIMAGMKRGFLTALLFFILALIAGTGDNAMKISKAIGGMVFLAMLLTSPTTDMIGNLDKFLKADWQGTSESGPVSSSATPSAAGTFSALPKNIQTQIEGQPVFTQFSGIFAGGKDVASGASKAFDLIKNLDKNILNHLGF